MANLSITRRCRRHCSYCFAKHELARNLEADMPPEVYETALAFLERSGFPEVRLLGGEPTEHPRFCEYVTQARERGFRVVIFSGGLIPQPVLEFMAILPADDFSVVLNAADPANDTEALVSRQREVCRALGAKVMLGVNIVSSNQNPTHVFDWVSEYDLCRTIRVGVAHPIWGGTNDYFRLRGPRVIPVFERLVTMGAAIGVNVCFDCGFTPCMFSLEFVQSHADMFVQSVMGLGASATSDDVVGQSEEVPTKRREAVGVRCGPVVDILPEGDCIACYALSRFCRLPLPTGGTRNDVVTTFDGELAPALPVGVHHECAQCDYRAKDMCGGGCRSRRALRLRPNAMIPLCPDPMGEREVYHPNGPTSSLSTYPTMEDHHAQ